MNGKNLWTNGSKTVKAVVKEGQSIPEGWYPAVNVRRVKGATYTPYAGDSVWTRAANRTLASMAQDNFSRR